MEDTLICACAAFSCAGFAGLLAGACYGICCYDGKKAAVFGSLISLIIFIITFAFMQSII